MPIDRVTQLEQALVAARDLLSDYQRRHEASERAWLAQFQKQQERVAWLESCLADRMVQSHKLRVG